jgi:hypothetical protein
LITIAELQAALNTFKGEDGIDRANKAATEIKGAIEALQKSRAVISKMGSLNVKQ